MPRTITAFMFALLVAGCASISGPRFGVDIAPEDVDDAKRYTGVAHLNAAPTIVVERSKLTFLSADRRLATVTVPDDWTLRVRASQLHPAHGRHYHWAISQWETPAGRKVDITLRWFGEDALFIVLDGEPRLIEPGAILEFDPDQHQLVAMR